MTSSFTTPEARLERAFARLHGRYGTRVSSRFVRLPGPPVRLHLTEAGSGPPVLYLHGHGGTGAELEPLLGMLQDRFHIYAPTRPGSGLSEKIDYRGIDLREYSIRWVTALLDALGLERVSVIGTSLGGLDATWLALAHPDRVERIVLLGGAAGYDRWAPMFFRLSGIPGLNRLLHSTVARPGPGNTRQLIRFLVAHPERVPDELLDEMTSNTTMPRHNASWLSLVEEAVGVGGFSPRYYVGGELDRVAPSVLLVWGDRDTNVRVSAAVEAARKIPRARLEILEDAGHLPWIDHPERCASLIRDFLGEPAMAV